MAGSSAVLTSHQQPEPSVGKLLFTLVGDDTDGSFPTLALPTDFDGRFLAIVTNPGTPAPTDNWDVAVNVDGFDMLGAAGANRDTATTERAAITDGYISRREAATLAVTGNSVNDAQLTVALFYIQHV